MSKIKMPKKVRTAWLKALRGGRYKQEKNTLQGEIGNCCLGTLGRILRVPHTELETHGMPADLDFKYASKFPTCLVKVVNKEYEKTQNTKFASKLANLNDDKDKNFKEIADYIEKHTIGV